MNKKYEIIYADLSKSIREKIYKVGDFLPTEKQLCAKYKASRPTVAKALEMLRDENVIERTAGYGTIVLESPLTKSLKIGLFIPRLGRTEIFQPIVDAMIEACEDQYIDLILPPQLPRSRSFEESSQYICDQFINAKLDGIIFTPLEHIDNDEPFNSSILEKIKNAQIPVVLLDRDVVAWPKQMPYDLIGMNNIEAGFVVADHLIKQGCRKITFLMKPRPAKTVQLRIMGCHEALLNAGLKAENLQIVQVDANEELTANIITKNNPDGIICANDATAAQASRILIEAGISVPETIKIAGFDDVKYAALLNTPLTTYRQPCDDIGQAVIQAMLYRLKNPNAAPRRMTLQGKLVIRQTTIKSPEILAEDKNQ